MGKSMKNEGGGKEFPEIKTFVVPFNQENINKDILINSNPISKSSEEQIINKAIKLYQQSNLKEAFKYFQHLINEGSNNYKVFSYYGIILKGMGKFKQAELALRKAIEIKPDSAIAYLNLGNILKAIGELKAAEQSQRQAIKLKPDLAEAHLNLGALMIDLNKPEDALVCYSNAISIKPDFKEALENRMKLFFEKKEFSLALKDADAFNTKESRAFALEILYAQGNTEEIYKRIEKNLEIDSKNIRVAAFSSFILENEKKDTNHNFCKKPLSFLHFSNLKSHINDYDKFINGLIRELKDVPTIWEARTTKNGFQTPSNLNLFTKTSENISKLKSIILNEINSYYLKFKNESCTFIDEWPKHTNLHAFYNIQKKSGYQYAHIHPDGWLSGVIYLKVVPSLNNNEGAIEFSLNGVNFSSSNSSKIIHQPKIGDIILFPSSLYHRTIPFNTDTERIAMAFDFTSEI